MQHEEGTHERERGTQIWVRNLTTDELIIVKLLSPDERAVLLLEGGRIKLLHLVEQDHTEN